MIFKARVIPLPFYGRILIERNNKWYGHPVAHSPKVWPWRKFVSIKFVNTRQKPYVENGHRNWNVWTYTRNDAICVNVSLLHKSIKKTWHETPETGETE